MNNYNIQWAIDCDSEQLKVSGHNLYKVLGIQKPYTNWFLSVCEYGFEERKDFEIIFPKKMLKLIIHLEIHVFLVMKYFHQIKKIYMKDNLLSIQYREINIL